MPGSSRRSNFIKRSHEWEEDGPVGCRLRFGSETPPRVWGSRWGGVLPPHFNRNTPRTSGCPSPEWQQLVHPGNGPTDARKKDHRTLANPNRWKHRHELGEGQGGGAICSPFRVETFYERGEDTTSGPLYTPWSGITPTGVGKNELSQSDRGSG